MSNSQLTFVAVGALAIHVLVLTAALVRRAPLHAFGLNLAVACILLAALAFNPKWLRPPIDLPVVAFAVLEVLVVVMAALAFRGHRPAMVGSWIAFALHLLASGLAVLFVLTFKVTRLF